MDEVLPEIQWLSNPEDLWNLTNLTPKELKVIYPDRSWDGLRRRRSKVNQLIKQGKLAMPEKNPEYDGNPEAERERANARRKRVATQTGQSALSSFITPEQRQKLHNQLDKAIDEYGGNIGKVTFTEWEMGYTTGGEEKTADKIPLNSTRVEVHFDTEPQWPVVTRIEGKSLPKKEAKTKPDGGKRAVILPDLQLPYVDEKALSVAIQIIQDTKPDQIIFIGDTLDLSAWGRFVQRPEFAEATRESFKQFYNLLYGLREDNRTAQIIVIEGNHEERMNRDLLMNAQSAYGLKRADQPEGWPVMSVPNLCAFDTLDIEYVPGYPANRFWLNERLQIIHGDLARPSGKSARAVVNRERVSTIFGHTHRIEQASQTSQDYHGGKQHQTFNIGTLSLINGGVPSGKSGYDSRTGQTLQNFHDWQHGLMVVDYQEGDKPFHAQQVHINTFDDYNTRFNGKTYQP